MATLKQIGLDQPIRQTARQPWVSEQVICRCKKWFAYLESTQLREIKVPQERNARLKRLDSDPSLVKTILP